MEEKYSLIIIGGGMTGLSTALAWLQTHDPEKDPVLILEKEPAPGGCVTTFARKGYRFDTVQIIPDISDLLKYYQIEIDLLPYKNYYARLFLADPDNQNCTEIGIPSSINSFRKMLIKRYPVEEKKIIKFFNYGQILIDELTDLKTEPTLFEGIKILFNCPHIIKQSFKTYREYLDSFRFKNEELLEILDIFSSFSGLSGNRCAALLTSCAMMTTLQGSYRPAQGFIHFPLALIKKIESRGGKIKTSTPVDKILIEKNKVVGVRCGDKTYRASSVVSTSDIFKTSDILLSDYKSRSDSWFKKLSKAVPSPSSFTIHLGLDDNIDLEDLGFCCGYNVLTTGRKTHEKCFDFWENGKLMQNDKDFHLAVISPSAMTGGKNNLIIHVTPAPLENWKKLRETEYKKYEEEKRKTADFYITKVEEYMIPDLKNHIILTDISTPATYERYLGTTNGANSQMLSVPSNFGMFRQPTRTPVKGLFIPQFSHGIWPCLQAGLQVVDMLTKGKIMGGRSRYIHDSSGS